MKRSIIATAFFVTVISTALFSSEIKLIEPEEAIKLIGDKKVVFVSGDSEDTYKNNHIVGSVEMYAHHLHHSDGMGNMHCAPLYNCPKEAQEYIRSKGIRNDQMIIAYDNFRGPNATGVYSFFESFGHKNVRLLNGGFDGIKAIDPNQQIFDKLKTERKAIKNKAKAAKEAKNEADEKKYKTEEKAIKDKMDALTPKLLIQGGDGEKITPSNYTLDEKAFDYANIADKVEVKKAVDDILTNGDKSKFAIIDSRAMAEIIGDNKMDNVARGGHIPGAKFIEWSNITDMENKKSFKSAAEMQKVFDKAGITKDQTIYAYCMVGAGRGSHIISALRLLGYKDVKVFTGSWDTWGNDMNLPIRR
jgi:thiosulfate/3-mercaptopyruvate sulfurtransferase